MTYAETLSLSIHRAWLRWKSYRFCYDMKADNIAPMGTQIFASCVLLPHPESAFICSLAVIPSDWEVVLSIRVGNFTLLHTVPSELWVAWGKQADWWELLIRASPTHPDPVPQQNSSQLSSGSGVSQLLLVRRGPYWKVRSCQGSMIPKRRVQSVSEVIS